MSARLPIMRSLRAHVAQPLFGDAYALIANNAVSAGLGLAYWLVAARIFTVEEVGRTGALITAVLALSTVAQLNFSATLPRFLPPSAVPARLTLTAYSLTLVLGLILGIGFVILAPSLPPPLSHFVRTRF